MLFPFLSNLDGMKFVFFHSVLKFHCQTWMKLSQYCSVLGWQHNIPQFDFWNLLSLADYAHVIFISYSWILVHFGSCPLLLRGRNYLTFPRQVGMKYIILTAFVVLYSGNLNASNSKQMHFNTLYFFKAVYFFFVTTR